MEQQITQDPGHKPQQPERQGSQANSSEYPRPTDIIFVLGAPGAGKGTLCKHHPVEYGYAHLSVGDYLRELCLDGADTTAADRAGLTAKEIKHAMNQTALLDAAPLIEILRFKLQQESQKGNLKFIIDGFPRTVESAKLFDQEIGKPSMAVLVDCHKDTARARFLARRREAEDGESKFEARYAQYLEENAAILEWYGPLVRKLDTECGDALSHERMLQYVKELEAMGKLRAATRDPGT